MYASGALILVVLLFIENLLGRTQCSNHRRNECTGL